MPGIKVMASIVRLKILVTLTMVDVTQLRSVLLLDLVQTTVRAFQVTEVMGWPATRSILALSWTKMSVCQKRNVITLAQINTNVSAPKGFLATVSRSANL